MCRTTRSVETIKILSQGLSTIGRTRFNHRLASVKTESFLCSAPRPSNGTYRTQQNWTHLLVQLTADQSESESIVASMAVEEAIVLTYQYRNTPKPGAKDTMHAHMGTGVLKLSANRTEFSGEYYSGRDRANQG